MSKQKVTIEVDVPEGYEATGEYRVPREGEIHLPSNCLSTALVADRGCVFQKIILRRIEPDAVKLARQAQEIARHCEILGMSYRVPTSWVGELKDIADRIIKAHEAEAAK